MIHSLSFFFFFLGLEGHMMLLEEMAQFILDALPKAEWVLLQ